MGYRICETPRFRLRFAMAKRVRVGLCSVRHAPVRGTEALEVTSIDRGGYPVSRWMPLAARRTPSGWCARVPCTASKRHQMEVQLQGSSEDRAHGLRTVGHGFDSRPNATPLKTETVGRQEV